MTTDQNRQIIYEIFENCIANKNFARLNELIDPNYVNYGFPDVQKGPEGFRQVIVNFYNSFPDMKITIEQAIAEGDTVATRGYWTGSNTGEFMGMPATGKRVTVPFIDFWKLQNGKATENWVQMDVAGMMQQMGSVAETA